MNQCTNRIQWNLLDYNESIDFFITGYSYEFFMENQWLPKEENTTPVYFLVYRLVIEEDKWYYVEFSRGNGEVVKGGSFNDLQIKILEVLRPARPDEIPQEKTLEQKIREKSK